MRRNCISCGEPTILGRYIDNHLIVVDAEPAADGKAVLIGDVDAEPTVVFGIDSEDDAEFYRVRFDAARHSPHECPNQVEKTR